MKPFILLILLGTVALGCRHPREPKVTFVVPALPPSERPKPKVRNDESVSVYLIGRYVDPGSSGVMHEAHSIYRVEQDPAWDLKPPQINAGPPVALVDPAHASTAPSKDEISARLTAQEEKAKKVEQALTAQAEALKESTKLTGTLIGNIKSLAEELNEANRRQRFLEEEIKKKTAIVPSPLKPTTPQPQNW